MNNTSITAHSLLCHLAVAASMMTLTPGAASGQAENRFETNALIDVPNPVGDERFGTAIAIHDTTAVIGAPGNVFGETAWPGRALIYELGPAGWSYIASLSWADGENGDAFGCAVDIDADRIVIGARNTRNTIGDMTGAAHVFNRPHTGWASTDQPDAILFQSDGNEEDGFGAAVAIDGPTIVVGAPSCDTGNIDAGAAYVFELNGSTWDEITRLYSSAMEVDEHFGLALAIDGDMLAVGAPNVGTHDDPGSVDCFRLSREGAWEWLQSFDHRDGEEDGDHFGRAIAFASDPLLEDRWMFVGCSGRDAHAGTVEGYRFDEGTEQWTLAQTIEASDRTNGDHFGFSLSVESDMLVIGGIWAEVGPLSRAGVAYRFDCNRSGRWVERAKVMLADSRPHASFGYAAAMYHNPFTSEPGALISASNFGGTQNGNGVDDAIGAVAIVEPSSVARQQ